MPISICNLYPGQLSLAIPPWVGEMSYSLRACVADWGGGIIIIIINEERIRVTLSHRDVAGALYIIKQACFEHWDVRLSAIVLKLVQKRMVEEVCCCLSPELH